MYTFSHIANRWLSRVLFYSHPSFSKTFSPITNRWLRRVLFVRTNLRYIRWRNSCSWRLWFQDLVNWHLPVFSYSSLCGYHRLLLWEIHWVPYQSMYLLLLWRKECLLRGASNYGLAKSYWYRNRSSLMRTGIPVRLFCSHSLCI